MEANKEIVDKLLQDTRPTSFVGPTIKYGILSTGFLEERAINSRMWTR